MSFDSWCQLHLSEVRRRLRVFMAASYRRQLVKEKDVRYWHRVHALERMAILTNRRPR